MREWNTGLTQKYVVPTLSQYIAGGEGRVRPSSIRREHIHRTLEAVLVTVQYSASVEDCATLCCFLEDQEIALRPM